MQHNITYQNYELTVTVKPVVLKQHYDLSIDKIPDTSTLYDGVCSSINFKVSLAKDLGILIQDFKRAVDDFIKRIPPNNVDLIKRDIEYHIDKIDAAHRSYAQCLLDHGFEFVTEGNYKDTCYYAVHQRFIEDFGKNGIYGIPNWAIVEVSAEVDID